MSRLDDGRFVCNHCGGDVGNAAVDLCAVVAVLVDTPGGHQHENLHFCLSVDAERGTRRCVELLLSAEMVQVIPPHLDHLDLYDPNPATQAGPPADQAEVVAP